MISGKQTDLIFLDFSKTFDKVNHLKLLYKLQTHGVQSKTFLIGGKLFPSRCSISLFRMLALYISTSLRSAVCLNSVWENFYQFDHTISKLQRLSAILRLDILPPYSFNENIELFSEVVVSAKL